MFLEKSKFVLLGIFCSVFALQLQAKETLYRWVDEQGNIFYSDKVPPEHKAFKRQNLNKDAQTISVTAAPKTEEQLEKENKIAELRQAAKKIILQQEVADKLLLKSFRSQKELDQALANKINMIDFQVKVAHNNQERLEQQLTKQMHSAAGFEKQGRPIPENLLNRLNSTKSQLSTNQELVAELEASKQDLKDEFEQKSQRFVALQKQGLVSQKAAPETQSLNHSSILSILDCSLLNCDDAWPIAKEYLIQHATTDIHIDTDGIVTTTPPIRLQQLSLQLIRITQPDKKLDVVFLDASCHHSSLGAEVCQSETVTEMLNSFSGKIEIALRQGSTTQKLRADASIGE